jgi:hypothetical protein
MGFFANVTYFRPKIEDLDGACHVISETWYHFTLRVARRHAKISLSLELLQGRQSMSSLSHDFVEQPGEQRASDFPQERFILPRLCGCMKRM